MKKVLLMLVSILLCVGLLAGCGSKGEDKGEARVEKSFNLYTWDGMFPPEVLEGFEKETGYKINFSHFDYDEDMLAKLEETKGGDYDLVIADDYIIELVIAEGLSQKLDTSKLENYKHYNPVFMSQFYDPKNEYTVPYAAGIPLIVYNPALTDVEIKGYEDLWNPALEDNVALIANYRVINGITLKTLGESFNTNDLDMIQKAGDKLLELAPNVRVINDSNTQDFILSEEVAAGFFYSSQVVAAKLANPDLKIVHPKEGLGFGIMASFIPSQAPNAEAAYAFLDYINRPEIAAKCYEYIGYYCANTAAEELIAEDMRDFLVLPADAAAGEIIQNVSNEAEELHSEIWSRFRNACE
ncbi:MAG: spermidine/putrescine ABC transporter substrate-binding protein [Lachnospiraceae bacterium]|nr:spermidine/putrescine ABC transporter substrate-binding protein [Lachnospiraceae bacterium]